MPAILTSNFSTINAENFVDAFLNGNSNVFLAVGRGDGSTATSDEPFEWTDETNPPTPVDSIEQQNDFRDNVIGIKRVMVSNIMLMVPRIEWAENRLFNTIDIAAVSGKRATDYFCINSENNVYQCMKTPGTLTKVGSEPQGFGAYIEDEEHEFYGMKGIIETTDGYTWRFLYNVTAAMVNGGMLLENWMPVAFNKHGVYDAETANIGTLTDYQYTHGDLDANRTLGAYRVLISCTLKNEEPVIPYTAVYRQVGLIVDPKNADGDFLEGDLYAPGEAVDQWDKTSGELVYLENKRATNREERPEGNRRGACCVLIS